MCVCVCVGTGRVLVHKEVCAGGVWVQDKIGSGKWAGAGEEWERIGSSREAESECVKEAETMGVDLGVGK